MLVEFDGIDGTRVLSVKTKLERPEVKALAELAKAIQVGNDLHLIVPAPRATTAARDRREAAAKIEPEARSPARAVKTEPQAPQPTAEPRACQARRPRRAQAAPTAPG